MSGRGPELEQIEGGDYPTCRVVLIRGGERIVHDELIRADLAMEVARGAWRDLQPLDEVHVVNERTGSTRDIISRT
jgi:hypothetical protein